MTAGGGGQKHFAGQRRNRYGCHWRIFFPQNCFIEFGSAFQTIKRYAMASEAARMRALRRCQFRSDGTTGLIPGRWTSSATVARAGERWAPLPAYLFSGAGA